MTRLIKLTSRLQHQIAKALPGTLDHIGSQVRACGHTQHAFGKAFNRMLAYRLFEVSEKDGEFFFTLQSDVEIEPESSYDQLYQLPRLFFQGADEAEHH